MSELRCSNSCVFLCDGQELYCENTPEDIDSQLSKKGKVVLDISETSKKITVSKEFIVNYYHAD